MRFRFIDAEKANHSVQLLCRVLCVSKQGYYAWRKRPPSARAQSDAVDVVLVREAHRQSRKRSGYRSLWHELKRAGHAMGKHRVARLMRQEFLYGKPRRAYRTTTDSNHRLGYAPNLLDRKFVVSSPNQVWLSDITYIPTSEGFLYLTAVLDLHSRLVVGWSMSDSLEASATVNALRMAIEKRTPERGLMVHSDRGLQYASGAFRGLLEANGFRQSMSRRANCWDNAPMESFFATLKRELVNDAHFRTRDQARAAVFEFVEVFYNRQRLHSALGYVPPAEYEERAAA
jgi:putative transposase